MIEASETPIKHIGLHPVIILLSMLILTAALTFIVPAGKFDRLGKQVVAGSYHSIPKLAGLSQLVARKMPSETDRTARATGIVGILAAIPAGMIKQSGLIFMLLFGGGMFGIIRATGAIDAAVDRLLHLTAGNVYLLTTGLMLLLACGSTFLGFITEYLAIIPLLSDVARKLALPKLYVAAVVILSSMIGFAASVTNPISLAVAQPLAGVPVFSGMAVRLALFIVMFCVGLGYIFHFLAGIPRVGHVAPAARLSGRQRAVLFAVLLCGVALVVGTSVWAWESPELAGAFVAFSIVLALVGRLAPSHAADAFLDGMRSIMIAVLMIGIAGAIEVVLRSSQIIDSIVNGGASLIPGHSPVMIAEGMMAAEMSFDILIHSTSAKAAVTIPLLAPIAHLSGLSGQVPVLALLLGSGVANMISPTNGMLLAFLASSEVGYAQWARFAAPIVVVFVLLSAAALALVSA